MDDQKRKHPYEMMIYLKYQLLGCEIKTAHDVVEQIESWLAWFKEIMATGKVEFDNTVDTAASWLRLTTWDEEVAKKYGFEYPEWADEDEWDECDDEECECHDHGDDEDELEDEEDKVTDS